MDSFSQPPPCRPLDTFADGRTVMPRNDLLQALERHDAEGRAWPAPRWREAASGQVQRPCATCRATR